MSVAQNRFKPVNTPPEGSEDTARRARGLP